MIYVGRDLYGQDAYLEDDAAQSYLRMRAAGCPAGITSALRSHQQQINLFLSRYRRQDTGVGPFGDVRYWAAGGGRFVRVTGAAVAVPGSAVSRHEKGLSLDLPDGGPREWVRAHGARFGWIKDIVTGESWHMEYQRARDTQRDTETVSNPGTVIGGKVPTSPELDPLEPLTPLPQEEDMPLVVNAGQAGLYLLDGGLLLGLDQPAADQLTGQGVKTVSITRERYFQWLSKTAHGVLIRSDNGPVAVSVAGSRFVGVDSATDYQRYQDQGFTVFSVPPGDFDQIVG